MHRNPAGNQVAIGNFRYIHSSDPNGSPGCRYPGPFQEYGKVPYAFPALVYTIAGRAHCRCTGPVKIQGITGIPAGICGKSVSPNHMPCNLLVDRHLADLVGFHPVITRDLRVLSPAYSF